MSIYFCWFHCWPHQRNQMFIIVRNLIKVLPEPLITNLCILENWCFRFRKPDQKSLGSRTFKRQNTDLKSPIFVLSVFIPELCRDISDLNADNGSIWHPTETYTAIQSLKRTRNSSRSNAEIYLYATLWLWQEQRIFLSLKKNSLRVSRYPQYWHVSIINDHLLTCFSSDIEDPPYVLFSS